ncbi:hypothetical protein [Desulfonatronovibrio hydrogenovorans]|uniref:hypothetical protein n=1 Tax=Desulfonatronovibrio hydrogenovorans TaxID=53245 RepID=UPI00048CB63B|nr:hypothetical protein [Desulfonatronovibrio hydrogenovorans]
MANLTTLQNDLALYRAAREKILIGQEYAIGSRRLRRPDLAEIEKKITELEARIAIVQRKGRINTGHVIFGGHRG